jgi:ABC-2 type transport system ATP-binding protein
VTSRFPLPWSTAVHGGFALALLASATISVERRVAWPLAVAGGIGTAMALFLVLGGGPGSISRVRNAGFSVLAAKSVVLGLRAASEEVVWRWFVLGAISARWGALAGLAVSTVLFALTHWPSQGRRGVLVHTLTGGAFGTIFVLTGSLLAAISAHVTYNLLIALAIAAERAGRGMQGSPARPDPQRSVVAELRDVHKRFGRTVALAGVTVAIRRGEVVALLGPNGAGKTTALSLLLGLRRPDAGEAALFERDPRSPQARRTIGATPQESGYAPTLTVAEHVDLVRAHYDDPAATTDILEQFGLAALRDRQAGGLSGGQRRRLAIALAFAGKPEAVFLDEPTVGLDVEARRAIWDVIGRYARDGGTVVLSTHNLEEAEALAGRIVVLAHGTIVADGSPDEIKAHSGFRRVRLRTQPLPELPGVLRLEQGQSHTELDVEDVHAVMRRLVEAGVELGELEVTRVSLEEAFLLLTTAR